MLLFKAILKIMMVPLYLNVLCIQYIYIHYYYCVGLFADFNVFVEN